MGDKMGDFYIYSTYLVIDYINLFTEGNAQEKTRTRTNLSSTDFKYKKLLEN